MTNVYHYNSQIPHQDHESYQKTTVEDYVPTKSSPSPQTNNNHATSKQSWLPTVSGDLLALVVLAGLLIHITYRRSILGEVVRDRIFLDVIYRSGVSIMTQLVLLIHVLVIPSSPTLLLEWHRLDNTGHAANPRECDHENNKMILWRPTLSFWAQYLAHVPITPALSNWLFNYPQHLLQHIKDALNLRLQTANNQAELKHDQDDGKRIVLWRPVLPQWHQYRDTSFHVEYARLRHAEKTCTSIRSGNVANAGVSVTSPDPEVEKLIPALAGWHVSGKKYPEIVSIPRPPAVSDTEAVKKTAEVAQSSAVQITKVPEETASVDRPVLSSVGQGAKNAVDAAMEIDSPEEDAFEKVVEAAIDTETGMADAPKSITTTCITDGPPQADTIMTENVPVTETDAVMDDTPLLADGEVNEEMVDANEEDNEDESEMDICKDKAEVQGPDSAQGPNENPYPMDLKYLADLDELEDAQEESSKSTLRRDQADEDHEPATEANTESDDEMDTVVHEDVPAKGKGEGKAKESGYDYLAAKYEASLPKLPPVADASSVPPSSSSLLAVCMYSFPSSKVFTLTSPLDAQQKQATAAPALVSLHVSASASAPTHALTTIASAAASFDALGWERRRAELQASTTSAASTSSPASGAKPYNPMAWRPSFLPVQTPSATPAPVANGSIMAINPDPSLLSRFGPQLSSLSPQAFAANSRAPLPSSPARTPTTTPSSASLSSSTAPSPQSAPPAVPTITTSPSPASPLPPAPIPAPPASSPATTPAARPQRAPISQIARRNRNAPSAAVWNPASAAIDLPGMLAQAGASSLAGSADADQPSSSSGSAATSAPTPTVSTSSSATSAESSAPNPSSPASSTSSYSSVGSKATAFERGFEQGMEEAEERRRRQRMG